MPLFRACAVRQHAGCAPPIAGARRSATLLPASPELAHISNVAAQTTHNRRFPCDGASAEAASQPAVGDGSSASTKSKSCLFFQRRPPPLRSRGRRFHRSAPASSFFHRVVPPWPCANCRFIETPRCTLHLPEPHPNAVPYAAS